VNVPVLAWVGVLSVILAMVFVDLLVFNRQAHEIRVREAAVWTGVWLCLGLGFGAIVYWHWGAVHAGQYLAGYLLEKSLAVDNLFVFAVVFAAFGIPLRHQHRVLFWGILGALLLRGGFIAGGVALLHSFHWAIYLFGALLLYTAWRTWTHRNRAVEESTPFLQSLRRRLPITHRIHGQHFFAREEGRLLATPLLAALVAVEIADVVFAIDSVPAVIAVTQEPFLVYTSNAFAILGLRAMYFFLAAMIRRFEYLSVGLVFILAYVGIKMLVVDLVEIPIWISLSVIVAILLVSIVFSWWKVRANQRLGGQEPTELEAKT
jgi:tellurite resistance protein TerC